MGLAGGRRCCCCCCCCCCDRCGFGEGLSDRARAKAKACASEQAAQKSQARRRGGSDRVSPISDRPGLRPQASVPPRHPSPAHTHVCTYHPSPATRHSGTSIIYPANHLHPARGTADVLAKVRPPPLAVPGILVPDADHPQVRLDPAGEGRAQTRSGRETGWTGRRASALEVSAAGAAEG
ncbi:uncharacterized protein BJ171DRAFT_84383 [Polychytrium aggregatum]|uniref:uncharacterized protein n=1 Tax=Polychytrium aggregatum TaxID=110093 RepID=UPI0022FDD381|nr:uncharacterized protein BJ171DRAFT_84383 [Polychytrium aggregatum]KAI9205181.1 hypothetical protein BJ171DRAFT_84383 [Polychytrium aggregatum]